VRHRAKLEAMRSRFKAEVHAAPANLGVWVPMTDLFGVDGTERLDSLTMPVAYRERLDRNDLHKPPPTPQKGAPIGPLEPHP